MTNPAQPFRSILRSVRRTAFPLVLAAASVMIATHPAQAQTFTVLHNFTGGTDGANPVAGVTVGGPGTLYGTAEQGGTASHGVVYELKQHGSGWTVNPLHEFTGSDGERPQAPVSMGPNGALYGTTSSGGEGYGTVFTVQPPATACKTSICYWNETVLHAFVPNDGSFPSLANLIFDQVGNIYGTTPLGGFYGVGTVFQIAASGGFSVLHNFENVDRSDGFTPEAGVIFDRTGNLYGTTASGGTGVCGNGCGIVFELTSSNGSWTETIPYDFTSGPSGHSPNGALIMDGSGNFYGTTLEGGAGGGTIFKLMPSGGGLNFSLLYTFGACSPQAGVTMDSAGNLYGTCSSGGAHGDGMVFKLTNSGGSWTFTDLHDFNGGSDGANPSSSIAFDNSGNLYGTAPLGGNLSNCSGGCGTVWEITP